MNTIKLFNLNVAEVVSRFYLMVAVVVVLGFLGYMTLAAILGYTVAMVAILGMSFRKITKKSATEKISRLSPLDKEKFIKKVA